MDDPPAPGQWDYAAAVAVAAMLVVAYVLYPDPIVKYGVWLTVFTVWMAWFVSYGVRWVGG